MTMERILGLAHAAALENWYHAKMKLEEIPENQIRKNRELRCWKEIEEIERLRKELIGKENPT